MDQLPTAFAFVDLETTGTAAAHDRITEVGVVTVDAGGVSEWSSLVNPGVAVPPFITALTGISDAMVASAPRFDDIAAALEERLAGRVFVAHNARFDHGFLKHEFARVGVTFRPTVLCTVKLSRRLYPGFAHHNLDALIERHRLVTAERHRALADARLLWQFWQVLLSRFAADELLGAVKAQTARPTLPPHLDPALVDELPQHAGVYRFYGENAMPLYIGKAKNLRTRILSHFRADQRVAREMELAQQVRRIDWIETAGEIGALLLEAQLVKRLQPIHNRLLRQSEALCAWRVLKTPRPPYLGLAQGDDLFFDQDEELYGLFTSARAAQAALRGLADTHGLCAATLGLEKHRAGKPCFAYQVKRCQGVCTGAESHADHHARLLAALEPWRLMAWPYPGAIGIRERDHLHLVDRWAYLGTARAEHEVYSLLDEASPRFDRDVYRILQPRLAQWAGRLVPLPYTRC